VAIANVPGEAGPRRTRIASPRAVADGTLLPVARLTVRIDLTNHGAIGPGTITLYLIGNSDIMTVIRGRQLTTFDVSPDGESVAIHVTDEQAQPATLVLPAECLHALMMTLPEMVRRSLHRRFHDETMRVVYPVGSWEVDGGPQAGTVIVTLRTPDGFQVSFGLAALELLRMANRSAAASMEVSGILGN
jgi:hypothetical protein